MPVDAAPALLRSYAEQSIAIALLDQVSIEIADEKSRYQPVSTLYAILCRFEEPQ